MEEHSFSQKEIYAGKDQEGVREAPQYAAQAKSYNILCGMPGKELIAAPVTTPIRMRGTKHITRLKKLP
jgi:hypothetical protein